MENSSRIPKDLPMETSILTLTIDSGYIVKATPVKLAVIYSNCFAKLDILN